MSQLEPELAMAGHKIMHRYGRLKNKSEENMPPRHI